MKFYDYFENTKKIAEMSEQKQDSQNVGDDIPLADEGESKNQINEKNSFSAKVK